MTDILDNVASESSDNEEIIKLFPRCKPKVSSDFNLNKIAAYHSESFEVGESNGNETELMQSNMDSENQLNHKATDYVNAFISSMECQRARKMDGLCSDEKIDSGCCPEDHSVVSGYDNFGLSQSVQDQLMGRRDSAMDVGQELSPVSGSGGSTYQEFKLRESRIEIAGGREVFSSSRSRMPKKRFSDEIVYQNANASEKELKRHSGEMHFDEKLNSYRFRSSRNYAPKYNSNESYETEDSKVGSNSWQSGADVGLPHHIWESSDSIQKTDNKDIVTLQECRSGLVVYETPVRGSEVIYDDIGDWTDSTGNGSVRNHGFSEMGEIRVGKVGKQLTVSTEALNSEDGISPHSCRSPVNKPSGKLADDFPFANGKLPNFTGTESAQTPDQEDLSSSDEMGNEVPESSFKPISQGSTLIGTIPIAEYEGSPRRYGPRPGHPHRIVTELAPSSSPNSKQIVEDASSSPGNKQSDTLESALRKNKSSDESCNTKMGSLTDPNIDCSFLDSETQKVLQEFYKQDTQDPTVLGPDFSELEYKLYRMSTDNSYVGRRLAQFYSTGVEESPKRVNVERLQRFLNSCSSSQDSVNKSQTVLDSVGSGYIPSPSDLLLLRQHEDRSLLDPFDHDCDTISTNPDTEDLAETEMGEQVGQSRNFTLSPETTDCDSNDVESEVSFENEDSLNSGSRAYGSMPVLEDGLSSGQASDADDPEMDSDTPTDRRRHHSADNPTTLLIKKQISEIEKEFARCGQRKASPLQSDAPAMQDVLCPQYATRLGLSPDDTDLDYLDPLRRPCSPPSPAPSPSSDKDDEQRCQRKESVDEAIKEIKQAILKSKSIPMKSAPVEQGNETEQPVWIPRPLFSQQQQFSTDESRRSVPDKEKHEDGPEDECDTDQETDRLLGKQRTEEERAAWCKQSPTGMSGPGLEEEPPPETAESADNDQSRPRKDKDHRKKGRSKEVLIHEPAVLIEGVLFRARYLGSTQLVCEGQPTKATRMMQAEEAVSRIKAPEGENQPSTEVDLFISTEKIMVLNTDLKEIMMDHSLRTISYIADIGDLVVLMARRRMVGGPEETDIKLRHTPKMICHVFESDEAQFIAQSIGQAFQVAYMEFLKANGIEDHSFVKEMDYQEVLNSQEIYGDELEMFAKKEMQKEVIVPKARGEILGVVIVESGWGSMLPTVVIANLSPNGAAARCGQLNIGDQIIAINGISLVGLPLSTCQNYIKNAKTQMVVKLTVVPCAPVVEVKIKRPDTKYQLGFSVQNGVICSLLRGGIAERGGVRVGHRIIEINGQSVVAVPHERIVNLLATSVGEILMKTMPTSMFRLLTGQETPLYI